MSPSDAELDPARRSFFSRPTATASLHSLRMLMGHSSLAVLQRYVALVGEDLERAHKAHSPVDRLLG